MTAGGETTNSRRRLFPWEHTLLRLPCPPSGSLAPSVAAAVASTLLEPILSRRVTVRPTAPGAQNDCELAWHATIRATGSTATMIVGVNRDLGRAIADTVSASISSIRGDGGLGSVERGILDFVALHCLDGLERLDRFPIFELVDLGGQDERLRPDRHQSEQASWYEMTIAGRSGLLCLPMPPPPPAPTLTIPAGDRLMLTCGIPLDAAPELLDSLAPGDLLLVGLPRDGVVEIRSSDGWIVGSGRILAATRERLEVEFEAVGVRPADGPWVGLGIRRFSPATIAPIRLGERLDLNLTPRAGNARVHLPDGRRLAGEAVTIDGRDAVRVLGLEENG